MYDARDASSKWKRDWQEHLKSWRYQSGPSPKNLFRHERHRVSGMTRGDDEDGVGTSAFRTREENCRSVPK